MSVRTWGEQPKYKIVRLYARHSPSRAIIRGLTLEQAHCSDINTSSTTAWTTSAIKRTKRYGPWFDSYTEDR